MYDQTDTHTHTHTHLYFMGTYQNLPLFLSTIILEYLNWLVVIGCNSYCTSN